LPRQAPEFPISLLKKVMKRHFVLLLFCLSTIGIYAQIELTAPLPDKLKDIKGEITAVHFPSPVHPVQVPTKKGDRYFWKHNTSVVSVESNVQITEFGAYIFYNDQWNLRVTMDTREFAKLFDCPKGLMKQGEPYTFVKNWRGDTRLYGGWALWYFIGVDESGNQVGGYARLETTDQLINLTK
jgi:hypothetical protein